MWGEAIRAWEGRGLNGLRYLSDERFSMNKFVVWMVETVGVVFWSYSKYLV